MYLEISGMKKFLKCIIILYLTHKTYEHTGCSLDMSKLETYKAIFVHVDFRFLNKNLFSSRRRFFLLEYYHTD